MNLPPRENEKIRLTPKSVADFRHRLGYRKGTMLTHSQQYDAEHWIGMSKNAGKFIAAADKILSQNMFDQTSLNFMMIRKGSPQEVLEKTILRIFLSLLEK